MLGDKCCRCSRRPGRLAGRRARAPGLADFYSATTRWRAKRLNPQGRRMSFPPFALHDLTLETKARGARPHPRSSSRRPLGGPRNQPRPSAALRGPSTFKPSWQRSCSSSRRAESSTLRRGWPFGDPRRKSRTAISPAGSDQLLATVYLVDSAGERTDVLSVLRGRIWAGLRSAHRPRSSRSLGTSRSASRVHDARARPPSQLSHVVHVFVDAAATAAT